MTYRPGYRPTWLDRSYATQIALAPLTAEESRRMVTAAAGPRQVPAALAERVLNWAEGNPLFIEELTRSMLEHGSGGDSAIPDTVHDVIAARIDRLAPDDRRLLEVAAVAGREVSHELLERAADLDDQALGAGLARLQAAELLLERGARSVRTYGFKHALTHAAAYHGVPTAGRAALHLRVLDALLALGVGSRPEMLSHLGAHAAAGGDDARALDYYRRAGLHLLARDANREAARCLEEALAALARHPPGEEPDDLALGFDLRFEAMQALYRIGELARIALLGREALALADRLGDPARLAEILTAMAHALSNEARHAEAMEAGRRALALAEAGSIGRVQVWAGIVVGRVCLALGRFSEGIACLTTAIEVIGDDGDRRYAFRGVAPSPSARSYLALCLARTGDLAAATEQAEAALRVAEAVGSPMDQAWAAYTLGRVHHARTDWDRAIPLLEQAAALSEREGLAPYLPRILAGLASAYAQSGRTAEAVPLLERALAAGRAIRLAYGETLIICQLGTTCAELGRLEEAAKCGTEALALARERGERGEEAWALLLLADAAARREPPAADEARGWYAQAMALGGLLGMQPLVARARLALGTLEHRVGRIDDARRHLARAAEEAGALGIAAWRVRAEDLQR
jgi:adenylate cyclase